MQQTAKYQFNLIEKDDAFSPDPLNENMEKLDNVLLAGHLADKAESSAREGADKDLDARVTALEAKKMVVGNYTGNCGPNSMVAQIISLGFYPIAVIVCGYSLTRIATRELWNNAVEVIEGGFAVRNNSAGSQFNMQSNRYHYIAFG